MKGKSSTVDLSKGVPYHADGELCRYWPAEDFAMIATTATNHAFYHQTYCNHLRHYVKQITEYGDLKDIYYGMELPAELAASMAALLGMEG